MFIIDWLTADTTSANWVLMTFLAIPTIALGLADWMMHIAMKDVEKANETYLRILAMYADDPKVYLSEDVRDALNNGSS